MDERTGAAEVASAAQEHSISLWGYSDLSVLPEAGCQSLPRGVTLGLALTPSIIASIHDQPNDEYTAEYGRANVTLAAAGEAVAACLQALGHAAVALAPTRVGTETPDLTAPFQHKTGATRAGLGWIGKTGLVITLEFGPAIRFTTVLTDAPLPVAQPFEESRCSACVRRVELCPPQAATNHLWRAGDPRSLIFDAHACRNYSAAQKDRLSLSYGICGRCVAVCPLTQAYLRRAGCAVHSA